MNPDLNEKTENGMQIVDFIPQRHFEIRPTRRIVDDLPIKRERMLLDFIRTKEVDETIEIFRKLRNEHMAEHSTSERDNEYPKIVILGTAAGRPTKSRNVTGILVRLRLVYFHVELEHLK